MPPTHAEIADTYLVAYSKDRGRALLAPGVHYLVGRLTLKLRGQTRAVLVYASICVVYKFSIRLKWGEISRDGFSIASLSAVSNE